MKKKSDNNFCKPFLDFVGESVTLDAATKELIVDNSRLVKFNRGEAILNAGSVCKYVYFIISGKAISSFDNGHGKMTTFVFYFNSPQSTIKNFFAVDYKSFLSEQPSLISIYTESPVKAIRLSKEETDRIIQLSPVFERWMRLIDERVYSAIFDRVFSLLTLSAKERYEKFLKEEPYLLNIFPNYHIASYLGIAPQSLSRIRTKLGMKP